VSAKKNAKRIACEGGRLALKKPQEVLTVLEKSFRFPRLA
jgi:hypothetical protein